MLKPIHGLVVVAVAGLSLFMPASAKNAFRLQMIEQYKLQAVPNLTTCQFCHQSASGGRNFNAFGANVNQYLRANGGNIGVALLEALKANTDSDKDGYADVLEVFAKTAPGNASSKPKQTVAALQASLKKSGGVIQFKAK